MITGLWKNVRLICGNPAHESHEIMELRQTPTDVFYACPKYYPQNREPDEKPCMTRFSLSVPYRPCMNRISVGEVEKMLDLLAEKIQEEEADNGSFFAKNYRFETRIGKYKVLQCSDVLLSVKALNKRARLAGNQSGH